MPKLMLRPDSKQGNRITLDSVSALKKVKQGDADRALAGGSVQGVEPDTIYLPGGGKSERASLRK